MFGKIPQHLIVTGSAWVSRVVIALVQVFSIRILLEGLETERYAVFVLLNALIAWYLLVDMGVGVSLQNYISEARAKGDDEGGYLALGAFVAGILLILAIGFLYLLSPYLSKIFLKQFDFMSGAEKSHIFFVSGMLFLGLGIGNISYKAWYSQYKGHLSNILPATAASIGLGLVWMVIHQQWDDRKRLLWCVVAFTLPSTLLSLASFIKQLAEVPSGRFRVTKVMLRNFMGRSLKFWLLYALATVVLSVDSVIISQYLSPHEIVLYGVTTRIFGFAAFFYTSFYAALWPYLTEAITKNDWETIKGHLRKAFLFSAGTITLFTLILLLFMPFVSDILSPREKLEVPTLFIILLGAYHLVLAWVHGFAVVLQSMSDLRVLIIWGAIQALFSIFFQVLFVQWWGLYGMTLGLIASFLLTSVWVCPRRVHYHYKLSMEKAS